MAEVSTHWVLSRLYIFVQCVQLLPATAMLGSGHSGVLTSGQLATSAAGGASSGAVLPVQSLGGAGGTAIIVGPNVYTDQELAMIVNG